MEESVRERRLACRHYRQKWSAQRALDNPAGYFCRPLADEARELPTFGAQGDEALEGLPDRNLAVRDLRSAQRGCAGGLAVKNSCKAVGLARDETLENGRYLSLRHPSLLTKHNACIRRWAAPDLRRIIGSVPASFGCTRGPATKSPSICRTSARCWLSISPPAILLKGRNSVPGRCADVITVGGGSFMRSWRPETCAFSTGITAYLSGSLERPP